MIAPCPTRFLTNTPIQRHHSVSLVKNNDWNPNQNLEPDMALSFYGTTNHLERLIGDASAQWSTLLILIFSGPMTGVRSGVAVD
jgi:hypothetical protein